MVDIFNPINHIVRQGLHMRQTLRPEVEAPGERPSVVEQLLHPFVVKNNPLAPPAPPAPSELKVMSFNVRLGGKDFHAVRKTLVEAKADLIGLQEVSRANAEKLAKDLGMHLTFYQSVRHNNSLDNGKAILSRFPIQEAESVPFDISLRHRVGSLWDSFKETAGSLWERLTGDVEVLQKRSLLRSTFTIGGKTVDFIDTHLATGDPAATAEQFRQLQAYVEERKRKGHEVILVGDFNTHFNHTPESKPEMAEPLKEWGRLRTQLTDAYLSAGEVRVTGEDGRIMTPEAARERLKAEGLSEEERRVLERIASGATSASTANRIDSIMSSEGLTATAFALDQQNSASDHEPLLATLKLGS